jgi:hypothetical protein
MPPVWSRFTGVWLDLRAKLTIVEAARERWVAARRGRGRTVCAGGAIVAYYRGRSTSTLGVMKLRLIAMLVSVGSVSGCFPRDSRRIE